MHVFVPQLPSQLQHQPLEEWASQCVPDIHVYLTLLQLTYKSLHILKGRGAYTE